MKRIIFSVLLLCFVSASTLLAQNVIYLSPEGNDQNADGSRQKPYYSLHKAFASPAATLSTTDTLFIEVASGNYFMQRTITLNKANARPIVVRGSDDHKPCFMGGMKVSGWEHWRDGIYRVYLPEVALYGFSFEQFYVNGKRATMARTPNEGFYSVVSRDETMIDRGPVTDRRSRYTVEQIKLAPEHIKALDGVEISKYVSPKVRFYHKWDNTVKPIENINRDSSSIYYSGYGAQPWNPVTTGSRYFFFDYLKALDAPREWYLDCEGGYLYYYPSEDEDMSTAFCIAPTLRYWIKFDGQPNSPVRDISFRNISFQYNSYMMPVKGNDAMQAAAFVEAAIECNYVRDISFLNCEMMHTGTYAVWMKQACHDNTIDHCYLYDLGAGGIKIGNNSIPEDLPDESDEVTSGNVVNNSIITNGGHVFPCGVGISLFHTAHNRITHNEISNLRYSGVSVGWVWGYSFNPAVDNLVAYNHIHHIGWGELSDMGAVYTLGVSPGTKVVHNIIHDIVSFDYGGWGLYTDEGSTGIVMSHNLVYRCKSGGFHQHYGKENIIENNIFAFGHFFQAQFTRVEEHKSFDFKRNIILQDRGQTLAGRWDEAIIDFADNIYWTTSPDVVMSFAGKSLDEWRQKEPEALVVDPMFVDAANDDFRFKSRKAIKKIGFEPLDYSKVGVYGSDEWKAKAKMPDDLVEAFNKAVAPILNGAISK